MDGVYTTLQQHLCENPSGSTAGTCCMEVYCLMSVMNYRLLQISGCFSPIQVKCCPKVLDDALNDVHKIANTSTYKLEVWCNITWMACRPAPLCDIIYYTAYHDTHTLFQYIYTTFLSYTHTKKDLFESTEDITDASHVCGQRGCGEGRCLSGDGAGRLLQWVCDGDV